MGALIIIRRIILVCQEDVQEEWDDGGKSRRSSELLALLLSTVVAGVYGESGTGCQRRALTASAARGGRYLSGLPRPSFVMTRPRHPTGLDSP